MFIPSTIRTSFGPRAINHRPMLRVSLTVQELHLLAAQLDREAAQAEAQGAIATADTLAWRAAALREAGR